MQETVPEMVAYDDADLRGLPDTWGMGYSNGLPQEIGEMAPYVFAALHTPPPMPCPPYCPPGVHPAVMGSIWSHLKHAATTPFRAAAQVADTMISTPFNVAARIANTPFALASRASSILPGASPDGGGSPSAPGPAPAAPPPDMQAPPDGGGDPNMSVDTSGYGFWPHAGHPRRHPHWRAHVAGFGLPSWLHNPFSSAPGKLLVSTVPGGATALQARDIANKALKSGDLKPEHVKAAAAVTRAARKGDPKAIAKIANVRKKAAAGDPHAEVALDRMKLVHTIDSGGKLAAGGRSAISHAYNTGLATLPRYGRRGRAHF